MHLVHFLSSFTLKASLCLIIATSSLVQADIKDDLAHSDASIAQAAIDTCTSKGKEMLPQLRKWASDDDPRLKLRARTALGRITGQFAAQTDLIWELDFDKAVEKAKAEKKPILMLHLFGKLNEEFC